MVIDTNCIISSLIKNGLSRWIIVSDALKFITPEYTLTELSKHKTTICRKAHLNQEEFKLLLDLLFEYIEIISIEEYNEFFNKAKTLIDDIDDVSFVALYLAKDADGIWSDDKHFKTQRTLKIYRTRDLSLVLHLKN